MSHVGEITSGFFLGNEGASYGVDKVFKFLMSRTLSACLLLVASHAFHLPPL